MCVHVQYPDRMSCRRNGCPNRQVLPDADEVYEWIADHYRRIMPQSDLDILRKALNEEYYLDPSFKLPLRLLQILRQAVAVKTPSYVR